MGRLRTRGPVNRIALIVRPKLPVAEWANACDPNNDPVPAEITLQNLEVILVDVKVECDVDGWIADHWPELFELRLRAWYVDDELWPENLTESLFREWFEVEIADSVVELGNVPFRVERW